MASRTGPPPKPTALRLIEGGGKMRGRFAARAKHEPKPPLGLREPPETLTDDQRAIWKRLEADTPDGLLTKVDHDLFTNYVVALSIRDTTIKKLRDTGGEILVRARNGDVGRFIVNPYIKEFRRISDSIRVMQQELGYTPASRTRIAVRAGDDDEDPLRRFLEPPKSPSTPRKP